MTPSLPQTLALGGAAATAATVAAFRAGGSACNTTHGSAPQARVGERAGSVACECMRVAAACFAFTWVALSMGEGWKGASGRGRVNRVARPRDVQTSITSAGENTAAEAFLQKGNRISFCQENASNLVTPVSERALPVRHESTECGSSQTYAGSLNSKERFAKQ